MTEQKKREKNNKVKGKKGENKFYKLEKEQQRNMYGKGVERLEKRVKVGNFIITTK